ncbi:putative pectate lyase [Paramyrothecium foliicola]|nr:putative pectate lyase [Paramyrothecium foliicola]
MKSTVITALSALLPALPLAVAQQAVWEQCGGNGWTGGTTCVAGAVCTPQNEWYSQCLPGNAPPQPEPTSTSTSTSIRTTLVSSLTTRAVSSSSVAPASSSSSVVPPPPTGSDAPKPPSSVTRLRVHPANIRMSEEPDFTPWTISDATSQTITTNGLTLTLSAATGFKGSSYKLVYARMVASLGERVVGLGVSTNPDSTASKTITLTIKGLAAGAHSLLAWHNAWDNLSSAASVKVAVSGGSSATVSQTVRRDNLWESASSYVTFTTTGTSQTVTITFTGSGADGRVFLNGLEIDTPSIGNQIRFPTPAHRDERVDLKGGSTFTASWKAPSSASSPTYNVYLGKSPTTLKAVSTGQTSTSASLTGLNTLDTFYWRVDVVSGGQTYIGRVSMFRAAQLAFPGAEGWGRHARGGRGGKIVKVTSLADGTEAGTLRHALTVATGPRTIVFDVGGVITLTSRLTVNGQYITLAGQTAPGKGVIIQGMPLGLSGATDVIFQHIRVRPGIVSGQTIDGMGMQGSNHCIMDRCSIGWAIDECFSSRSAHNITLQRTMISEPLNVAGHQNYPAGTAHGYAATIGGNVGSFHHNLIAHAEGRSWSMGGGLDEAGNFAGRLDIRNNVVYNFGGRVTDGGASKVNFVGNLYKRGPASTLTYALSATYEDNFGGAQQYHCAGNSMPGVFTQDSVQYPGGDGTGTTSKIACTARVSFSPAPTYQKFFAQPFFESYVQTQTSTEAYKRVLSDSGAQQPVFDDHDKRIVKETLGGTTTYTGSKSGKKGLIDSPKDAGGLESFPTITRSSSWDANNDGIADWWDGSTGGSGYTALEGYLNFMADPHVFVSPSKSVTIDLAALSAGFTSPTFTVSGATKGSTTVSGNKATYAAGSSAGIDFVNVAIKDSEGSTWTRKVGIAIFANAETAN